MSLRTNEETRFGLVRSYPTDLALVSLASLTAYSLVIALPPGSVVRLLVTLPFLFFLPGYAIVSTLFPGAERPARASSTAVSRPGGIDTVERLGLSFALSIALVPIVALPVAITDWGLAAAAAATAIVIVTVGFAQLGVVRRLRLPESDRFVATPRAVLARLGGPDENGSIVTTSTALLLLAMVAAGVVLTVALATPLSGAEYTELGLYTETEDGEYVAGDFPDEIAPGESIPFVAGVENQEGQQMDYTLVVQEQRLDGDEVVERSELTRIDYRLSDGSTGYGDRTVTPQSTDGTVRISFLLYETSDGDVPNQPTNENADQDVYFWTTVAADTDVDETIDVDEDDEDDADDGAEEDDADEDDGDEEDDTDEDDGAGEDDADEDDDADDGAGEDDTDEDDGVGEDDEVDEDEDEFPFDDVFGDDIFDDDD